MLTFNPAAKMTLVRHVLAYELASSLYLRPRVLACLAPATWALECALNTTGILLSQGVCVCRSLSLERSILVSYFKTASLCHHNLGFPSPLSLFFNIVLIII